MATAQSCTSTPPDNNCIIYVNPAQAGTDDTGTSLGDYVYNFSPPTAYNGDTNDAGLRIGFIGGAGGNASGHGDTGGTGGSVGSLTVSVSAGTTIEGSMPEGAINLYVAGGAAGGAMYGLDSMPTAATGGNGGTLMATLNGTTTASDTDVAVSARSVGGAGGAGHDGGVGEYAANGGTGGAAEDVTVSQGGPVSNSTAAGIFMLSQGGQGQTGGNDKAGLLQQLGGDGGDGGQAGNVDYTLNGGQTLSAAAGYGLMIQSIGGDAGDGGYALDSHDKATGKDGGSGGDGGGAGTVTVTIDGSLIVTGVGDVGIGSDTGIGILAQSFGGQGGSGGTTDAKIGGSGGGGYGATGSKVTVQGTGSITTQGATESAGVIVQSIGGGGGVAGNDTGGGMSVGGDGGNGADGGPISLPIGAAISTSGLRSGGIVAQAIGGGGGTAGSVTGSGAGLSYIVGGTGGAGGDGGPIDGTTSGVIQTKGAHSSALTLQSLGGGGGAGGAAMGQTSSEVFGATVAIGGDAGGGGNGQVIGTNAATRFVNSGVLYTLGSDSHGLLAQSIGGGGGVGGASMAETSVQSQDTDPPVPNLALSVSVGGTGGGGGAGEDVMIGNSGFVMVEGEGASGLVAQSISGGGGAGGDSKAHSTINGDAEYQMAASLTFGGSGGGGGAPGTADVLNSGLIIVIGESGMGLVAQTIGAGGGLGGSGDGSAKSKGDSTSATTEITLGGKGGNSGDGGTSNVTNQGGILTLGDGGYGMFAQSIGGGGGKGGGAAGTQNGGTLGFTLNIGGNGGNAGDGGDIAANNSGSIATFGADAAGIMVQSIGGSGGDGGKAGSTLGGGKSTGTGGNGSTQTGLSSGLNLGLGDQTDGNGGISPNANAGTLSAKKDFNSLMSMGFSLIGEDQEGSGDAGSDLEDLAEDSGDADDGSEVDSFSLNVAVGGKAGAGGSSVGTINVTNTGTIGTVGQSSEGIFAQSIGGGGGKGGAASSSTNSGDLNLAFGVGGQGGAAGNGGAVNVYNTGGAIVTTGGLADGIIAQSVGGGGGKGGVAGSKTGLLDGLGVSLGGDGGANGNGGAVLVQTSTTGGSADGSITTRSHHAIGIVAQSVGGGGGIVKALSTDKNNGGGIDTTGDSFQLDLTFGGSGGASGSGSTVNVTAGANIATSGRNSHGILAQSIGGGGGLITGSTASGADFFGTGTMSGGASDVNVTAGGAISTANDGAVGIFAQSIGGGGGVAGDIAATTEKFAFNQGGNHSGAGSTVEVTLNQGGTLSTSGSNAPAIIAQSVGGGGGWITSTDAGLFQGSAGGAGASDTVTVTVDGAITTTGFASLGVFAQSAGGTSNGGSGASGAINVTVGPTGSITVGQAGQATPYTGDGAAIYISQGTANPSSGTPSNPNVVTNNGTVQTYGTVRNAVAVYSTGGYTQVVNNGTMNGDVLLQNGNGSGCFTNSGNYGGGDAVTVGACPVTNTGTITIGQAEETSTLTISGSYRGSGRLVFDADFAASEADRLEVTGDAMIGDKVEIRPLVMHQGTVEVVRVAGELTLDEAVGAVPATFFRYELAAEGGALRVTPAATFAGTAEGTGRNREAVAGHLQSLWDGGTAFDAGFTALAGVANADAPVTLDILSGQALGLIGATRYQASLGFIDTIWSGCDATEAGRCTWGRWVGTRADMDGNRDATGYETRSNGFRIGGGMAIDDTTTVGAAIGYESFNANGDNGLGHVDGDAVQLGGYVTWESGAWRLGGAAELSRGWFDTSRIIALDGLSDRATGSTDSWHAGLHGRAAWHQDLGQGWIEPRLDLSLLHIETDGFTEEGASPFNLAVDGTSDTTLIATPTLAVGTEMGLRNGSRMKLFGSVGYALMSDDAWAPTARLVEGTQGFTAETPLPDRLWKLALGAELVTAGQISLSATYRGDFGSGYDSHSAELRLDYRF